ncbi:helix-turn-helix domain-containing protein [Pseudomonas sp. NCCP-436]|uniref:helix-turn-helix domain-containing protein n=1 Tax=Pseudomonas sp. NCCP-436 TaxID=2842481 RepID=UPI001C7F2DAC|nr:XRE family transcriptional regulator [Pseudomonas sp. NCCP-436]GIZ13803.1 transcriptional regulator [Pseudomonas sp. NCCP-436]
MDKHDEMAALAILIHDLRKHKKVTLNELAERIGRSVGFLSQVERGLSRPTMADLTAISEALDVPTNYFYNLPKAKALHWVTRPGERRTLYLAGGITDIMASPTLQGTFTLLESVLEPGASSGERQMSDRSEQGGYVLEGQLTMWLGEEESCTTLYPGDAFQIPSYARLRYANQGDTLTRVLWVYT